MRPYWKPFLAEFLGTALLVAVGVSIVIFDFGRGSPVAALLPSEAWRRLLTGFLFGATGAWITISPLGKESGAHLNPAVSLAFCLKGNLRLGHALGYVVFQLMGGIAGALPLLLWARLGPSVAFGATLPGQGVSDGLALAGEVATTFAMITLLLAFVGHRRLRSFTPLLFPFLYAVLVFVEAPLSGTSTNPARSLGPALVSGAWQGWWIDWLGPLLGALLGVAAHTFTWLRRLEIEVAKLYHFEHDPHGIFGRRPNAP